jgi:hypothetical protein
MPPQNYVLECKLETENRILSTYDTLDDSLRAMNYFYKTRPNIIGFSVHNTELEDEPYVLHFEIVTAPLFYDGLSKSTIIRLGSRKSLLSAKLMLKKVIVPKNHENPWLVPVVIKKVGGTTIRYCELSKYDR